MARSTWTRAVAGAALAATAVWGTAGASAAPAGVDFETTLSDTAKTFTWDGTTTVGVNPTHFEPTLGEKCGDTPDTYCDRLLVTVDLPVPAGAKSVSGSVTVGIGEYSVPASDFDIFAYASDATGARGARLANSGNNPGDPESVTLSVTSTATKQVHHLLVEVPYFVAAGSYKGTATFKKGSVRS